VRLYAAGGFTSLSLPFEAAPALNRAASSGKRIKIVYIGDYDPAGVLIDVAIEREIRQHLDLDVDFLFERIGITAEQIEEYDLPRKPRKEGDRRARHIQETVEAEAMPARIMRELLERRLEDMLPEDALANAEAESDLERAKLRATAEEMDS
jgi:hypothetical protein